MRRRPARLAAALVAAAGLAAVSGCASTAPQAGGELTVSAAASLTEAFTEIAKEFEAAHPGTSVRLNFGGSSSLAEQVVAGAPVDVLATASRTTMDTVVTAGEATEAPTFATNALTIAVPRGNPAGIGTIGDLAQSGRRVAECAPEVPCGAAAANTLENAGVRLTPVTLDPDVKTVLGRVAAGEVDAGLVYVTDVRSADVDEVPISPDVAATTDYAIAVIDRSDERALARDFVAYVLGDAGQRILAADGFGPP